jgi:hypothetical protein
MSIGESSKMPEDELKLPKSDKWEIIYKAGKVGGAVAGGMTGYPGFSTLASELYSAIIKAPMTKRTDEFLMGVFEKLIKLEQKVYGFNIESLKDNELFISLI